MQRGQLADHLFSLTRRQNGGGCEKRRSLGSDQILNDVNGAPRPAVGRAVVAQRCLDRNPRPQLTIEACFSLSGASHPFVDAGGEGRCGLREEGRWLIVPAFAVLQVETAPDRSATRHTVNRD